MPPRKPGFSRSGLALFLNLAGLGIMLRWLPSRQELWERLGALSWSYLLLALALAVFSWTCDARRLQWLARLFGRELSWRSAIRGVLAGNFMINITPFYVGAGLVHTLVLQQAGASWWVAAAAVATGALLANAVQVGLAWLVMLSAGASWLALAEYLPLMYAGLSVYTLVIFGPIFLLWRFPQLPSRFQAHRHRRGLGALVRAAEELSLGWQLLLGQARPGLFPLLGWSLAYFLSFHSVAYALWSGLGVSQHWTSVIALQILIFVLFSVVPTPGGSGALELGAMTVLVVVAPAEAAAAFVILWRFFSFYLNLAVGWLALSPMLLAGQREAVRAPAGDVERDGP